MDVTQHKSLLVLIFNYNFIYVRVWILCLMWWLNCGAPTDSLYNKALFFPKASRLAGRPLEPPVQLVTSLPI